MPRRPLDCACAPHCTAGILQDVSRRQDVLADALYQAIPLGVGEAGVRLNGTELDRMLKDGMKWAEERWVGPSGRRAGSRACLG